MAFPELKVGRQPVTLYELDQDFCTLVYGESPCTAELGVTGERKCFNTRVTCQDPENYDRGTLTLTFAEPRVNLPRDRNIIPLLQDVDTVPTKINVGGGDRSSEPLGQRASVTAVFKDAPHSDLLVDPYRDERITGIANEGSLGDEGTEPDTVPDTSGNNNDGTNNGATVAVVDGRAGLEFDGDGDYVDIPQEMNSKLGDTTTFTISLWFKDGSDWDNEGLFEFGYIDGEDGAVNLRTENGGLTYRHDFGSEEVSFGDGYNDDNWHHFAVVYDGSEVKIYLDGDLKKSFNYTNSVDFTSNDIDNDSELGSYFHKGRGEYQGMLSEVRVWNTARTQQEIQDNMNKRLTGNEPGLVGYWPMRGKPYDPLERGTFWSKWARRTPYYQNRRVRVREGYVGQPVEEMRTRHYFIDRVDGPDSNGRVRIKAKDVLKLADNDRAQWPEKSPGELDAEIGETDSSLTIRRAEIADYDPDGQGSGTVRVGDEIILWDSISESDGIVTLSSLTRGAERTDADSHDEGDTVQRCQRYTDAALTDVLDDILTKGSNVPSEFIPMDDWDAERDRWLSGFNVSVLLTEPFGATELLAELTEQCLFYIWWDERDQEIKFKAIRPVDFAQDEAPVNIDDESGVIGGTFQIEQNPEERVTQVWTLFGQIDPTEDVEEFDNYRRIRIFADARAESDDEYGEKRIRRVYARWLQGDAQAITVNRRIIARYRDNPVRVRLALDAKDRDLKTADIVDLSTRQLQDDTGAQETRRYQVIRVKETEPGHRQDYVLQRFEFMGRYAFIMEDDAPVYSNSSNGERQIGGFFAPDADGFEDNTEAYRFV